MSEQARWLIRASKLFSSALNYADLEYELEIYTLPKQLITV